MGQFEQLDQLLETQDGMLRTAQVVSAGISKPVFYDYVHSRELERVAHGIYLAKAIDGVYDSDPKVNPSAKKYDQVSIQEVIDKKLAVVDLTASVMCMENHIPMYVFGLGETNSIVNAVNGQFNGTVVTVD